ncbi:hypothetical protein QN277_002066 [Acacia crassicarpa]|uniref:NPF family transporter n=1 Tax=Acacia crassicarpa TaxID=499986 RepID=A0AAE1NA13_9FABA|nr:hypothetical protein QN277_002066 [Acacia crassicarpa]
MDTTNEASKKASSSSSDNYSKSSTGGWNAVIILIFVEMAERFAFYGLTGNLITFLTNDLKETTFIAAKIVNTWVGVSFVFPLLGAFIADSYLGRFNTIIFSSAIYLLGMILLTVSVSAIPLESRKAVFFIALYILAIGEAGQTAIIQSFAVNQFEESSSSLQETRIAKGSFFNWCYFAAIIGHVSALSIVIYVQDNVGWATGFSILAAALAVAFAVFCCGMNKYRSQVPLGSPFTSLAQVLVAAARKWRASSARHGRGVCYGGTIKDDLVVEPQYMTLSRTKRFRFLDKAMIIDDIDASRETRDPWRLCSLNQVEETKQALRLTPIWLTFLYNSVALAQLSTFFTKQATTMTRSITIGPHHFTIPPASLQCVTGLTIILIIPIYDRLFVRLAGKFTSITMLQRIGVGLFFSVLTMLAAALVETKRVKLASDYNLLDDSEAMLPIRVWWLLPQYILSGVSEAFGVVGLQHFLYDQLPEAKRSLGAAFCICNLGIGNFISSGIIYVVEVLSKRKWLGNNYLNRSRLDLFYFLLAGLGFLNLGLFVFVAKRYVYRNAPENNNDDSKP